MRFGYFAVEDLWWWMVDDRWGIISWFYQHNTHWINISSPSRAHCRLRHFCARENSMSIHTESNIHFSISGRALFLFISFELLLPTNNSRKVSILTNHAQPIFDLFIWIERFGEVATNTDETAQQNPHRFFFSFAQKSTIHAILYSEKNDSYKICARARSSLRCVESATLGMNWGVGWSRIRNMPIAHATASQTVINCMSFQFMAKCIVDRSLASFTSILKLKKKNTKSPKAWVKLWRVVLFELYMSVMGSWEPSACLMIVHHELFNSHIFTNS